MVAKVPRKARLMNGFSSISSELGGDPLSVRGRPVLKGESQSLLGDVKTTNGTGLKASAPGDIHLITDPQSSQDKCMRAGESTGSVLGNSPRYKSSIHKTKPTESDISY